MYAVAAGGQYQSIVAPKLRNGCHEHARLQLGHQTVVDLPTTLMAARSSFLEL